MTEDKKMNMPQSIILLLLIIGSVAVCIRLKTGGPMIGLFFSWVIIYLFCLALRIDYTKIIGGAYDAIRQVVPTLVLLMSIGVMIGTWLQSGTIATIIVGGLQLIDPTWLLPLTLIFCAVLSLVTGTSYGSVGSAGVAMMAIGNAMSINSGMVAGAVICGAMFGDKLSPLSDTTNLAPAVAGAKLGDHVKSMLWTTVPAFLVSLVIFTILGVQQTSGGYTAGDLNIYIEALNGEFRLGFVTLLPAILLIILLILKVNAVASLGLSSLVAGLVSFFYQGIDLSSIIKVAYNGYSTSIEVDILQTILNRGGMTSMLQYVAIISFAVGMGGMLDKLGVLDNILHVLVSHIKSDGSLIVTTLLVGYATSIISCSQPMAHVLTGRLMAPIFKERKIAPEILSRTLEDSGTLAGPMIPWHGYCVYMSGTLGVAWAAFFPYLFMLYLTPLFSIFYGFTGISIKHIDDSQTEA
ncbi:MAG: Na+/H+ antiporter NhaC [Clostridiales bacterium]|nr:Na+/H+ antiporter NhaC [Clostridiales bacterium]